MTVRRLADTDSIEALTLLIRRAYKSLADMGFRYWATHQSPEDTRTRIAAGECYVAVREAVLVGTITLNPPGSGLPHPWYQQAGTAVFQQFAVEPDLQGGGIGSALMDHVEQRARGLGAKELACDTAEGAAHLIAMYQKRGFRVVGEADWDITNYRSVILSKTL